MTKINVQFDLITQAVISVKECNNITLLWLTCELLLFMC